MAISAVEMMKLRLRYPNKKFDEQKVSVSPTNGERLVAASCPKLARAEAEFLVALAMSMRGTTQVEFSKLFAGAFCPHGKIDQRTKVMSYTYPAKDVVDMAIRYGVVREDGGSVGLNSKVVEKAPLP